MGGGGGGGGGDVTFLMMLLYLHFILFEWGGLGWGECGGWGGDVLDDVIVSYFISFYFEFEFVSFIHPPGPLHLLVSSVVNVTCTSILKTLLVYRGEEEEEEDL